MARESQALDFLAELQVRCASATTKDDAASINEFLTHAADNGSLDHFAAHTIILTALDPESQRFHYLVDDEATPKTQRLIAWPFRIDDRAGLWINEHPEISRLRLDLAASLRVREIETTSDAPSHTFARLNDLAAGRPNPAASALESGMRVLYAPMGEILAALISWHIAVLKPIRGTWKQLENLDVAVQTSPAYLTSPAARLLSGLANDYEADHARHIVLQKHFPTVALVNGAGQIHQRPITWRSCLLDLGLVGIVDGQEKTCTPRLLAVARWLVGQHENTAVTRRPTIPIVLTDKEQRTLDHANDHASAQVLKAIIQVIMRSSPPVSEDNSAFGLPNHLVWMSVAREHSPRWVEPYDWVAFPLSDPTAMAPGSAVPDRRLLASLVTVRSASDNPGSTEAIRIRVRRLQAVAYSVAAVEARLGSAHTRASQDSDVTSPVRVSSSSGTLEQQVLGDSPVMVRLRRELPVYAARLEATHILITGETGTGKDRLASVLHQMSQRANQVFCPPNLQALSPTLIEAELFGHKKGSFASATEDREGLLAIASKGTIFLNEIGYLPPDIQAKLNTFLDNGKYFRVGDSKVQVSSARVIAATDAPADIQPVVWRRLSKLHIVLPPLRERKADLPVLLRHFLRRAGWLGQNIATEVINDVVNRQYQWPHNAGDVESLAENIVLEMTLTGELNGPLLTQMYNKGWERKVNSDDARGDDAMWRPQGGIQPRAMQQASVGDGTSSQPADVLEIATALGIHRKIRLQTLNREHIPPETAWCIKEAWERREGRVRTVPLRNKSHYPANTTWREHQLCFLLLSRLLDESDCKTIYSEEPNTIKNNRSRWFKSLALDDGKSLDAVLAYLFDIPGAHDDYRKRWTAPAPPHVEVIRRSTSTKDGRQHEQFEGHAAEGQISHGQ